MNLLFQKDLEALMQRREGKCVSIYLPTHRGPAHSEPDRIRFKNLLAEAEKRLIAQEVRTPEARALLAPAHALLDHDLFWRHQADGLAVFLAQGIARYHRLPCPFEELLVVGHRFHIKPLLPLLSGDGRFHILALSQDEVRLLEGTRHGVDEVELKEVPHSLAEALRFDVPEKQLQWHTRAAERGPERAAMFHGNGVGKDDSKDRILRFFRAVDAGLRDVLGNGRVPLVLAGVDYYFPIYQEANTYPGLLRDGVAGNPAGLQPETLHQPAWEIVRPLFERDREAALERFRNFSATGKTSASLKEILQAACQGRVDTLFVRPDVQRWGTFDPEQGRIDEHDECQPGDEDLLDRAVLCTLSTSGTVYPESPANLPEGKPLAAVYRY